MNTRFDLSLRRGELLSAVAALVLLILMFATEWFGVDELPSRSHAGAEREAAENAWNGLTDVRWLLLLTIIVAVGSVLLHANQRGHGAKTDTGMLVTALGCLSTAALIYRVLLALPTPDRVVDQKLGAVLGVLATVFIAVGGFATLRDERSRAQAAAPRARAENRVASGRAAR